MYKLLLILKYLRRKLAPMFAALAVTLCTAMVIIVISVMGGFLDLLRDSAQRLTGDVIVTAGTLTGFPHYDEMIEKLEALPEVATATPVVRGFGLVQLEGRTIPVQVEGVRPEELNRVVQYRGALYWGLPQDEGVDLQEAAMELRTPEAWVAGSTSSGGRGRGAPERAMVIGIEVNPRHVRDEQGRYRELNSAVGTVVTLTVAPVTQQGGLLEPSVRPLTVVNEFKSGLYEVDANRVYVPFELLQAMLRLDAAERVDPETGLATGETIPARASEVVVKAAAGVSPEAAREAAEPVVHEVFRAHRDMPLPFTMTWEQRHAQLLGAVQNEKGLVTFLFAIISVVAIVMVATTFYMTVLEKTRDIGVLRAIGASRLGIMNVFLGYGLAIGVVGAGAGLAVALGVVTNLNAIQDVIARWTGWRMWDPQTYFFDRIPDRVDLGEAGAIVLGAVVSAVVGALIPAVLAARQDPIEALRYE